MKILTEMNSFGEKIGPGQPMYIVAEMGQNHNGKLSLAKKILDEAKKAGVNAVKLQTLTAEKLVSKKTPTYGELDASLPKFQWLMYKQAELSRQDHRKLFLYAKKIGITLFSTPFDEKNTDFLDELGVPMFKIASGDLTHLPLIRYVAKKGKLMIIATGMATLKEVKEAVRTIESVGNNQIVILHCISSYPCPPEYMNLNAVKVLMRTFPYPIGLSDHSLDNNAAIALAAMGGKMLEKHFTCDKKIKGIDHWLSADGKQMKQLIRNVRLVEKMMGGGQKKPNQAEKQTIKLARRSVVSTVDIPRGSKISVEMLSIRRPGTGILPKEIDKVIGKVTKVKVPAETPILWRMLR